MANIHRGCSHYTGVRVYQVKKQWCTQGDLAMGSKGGGLWGADLSHKWGMETFESTPEQRKTTGSPKQDQQSFGQGAIAGGSCGHSFSELFWGQAVISVAVFVEPALIAASASLAISTLSFFSCSSPSSSCIDCILLFFWNSSHSLFPGKDSKGFVK